MGRDLSLGSSLGPWPGATRGADLEQANEALVGLLCRLTREEVAHLLYGLTGQPYGVTVKPLRLNDSTRAMVARWSKTTKLQAWTWAGQALDERRERTT